MIRIHILGAGGATPLPGRSPAAYHLDLDGDPILMDPGPGALVRLVAAGLAPRGVDDVGRVLLSHLHVDHTLDLIALLFAAHSPLPEREDPIEVWGPPGLAAWFDAVRGVWGRWLEPRRRELRVTELVPGRALGLPNGGTITPFVVDHPQDRLSRCCFGFTFTDGDGRRVVYSGDTGPCAGLTDAARGADLLVVECSTTDELATPGHMTIGQVRALCTEARPRTAVLTHQYPPAAAVDLVGTLGAPGGARIILAVDGTVCTVSDGEGDDRR
ncbi:MAG TPA: MBL fold metallo-hydrolase [Candidatus Krumholzibacteria bacterium]|nr:MBL fold metallo-hydrolase [Candidatus Krumholzibacteria bacterium]